MLMLCRCAAVSFTLPAVTGSGGASSLFEQPLSAAAAASAATAITQECLGFTRVRGQLRSIPPSASQGLKQCRRVGIAAGLCLNQIDLALLIRLLGAQQRQIAGVAVVPLALRQVEGELGGIRGGLGRLQGLRVLYERRQGVGDVLECGEDRASILLGGLGVRGLGGALLVQELPPLEQGRRCIHAHAPETGALREQLIYEGGRAAGIGD